MREKSHSSGGCERILLPEQGDVGVYVDSLRGSLSLASASESTLRYLVLDTFDWRLFHNNLQLRATKSKDRWFLELYLNCSGTLQASLPVSTLPDFVTELAAGSLSKQISKIVVPRALLPVLEFETKRLSLVKRNAEEKMTATLNVDTSKVRLPKSRIWHSLEPCLDVVPVRGYPKTAKQIRAVLKRSPGTCVSNVDPIDRAVQQLDLVSVAESNSKCLSLTSTQAALPAIAQCLQHLLEIMERNEDGIVNRIDAEFLHDFRIAIRRTRTVLSQLDAVFPGNLAAYETKFSWLSELTGPARDADVLILKLEQFRDMLPSELHATLPALQEFLQYKRHAVYNPLIEALQSQDYKRFKTNWRRFLKRCLAQPTQPSENLLRVSQVANRKIWKLYSQVVNQGAKIEKNSPASDYHRLRKTAKKLRYLMEFFQSLYSSDDICMLIKETKRLQDNLGEHQDMEVQMSSLTTYAKELGTLSDKSPDLLAALERICRQMNKRKRRLRNKFRARFEHFAVRANKKQFKTLFHKKSAAKNSQ